MWQISFVEIVPLFPEKSTNMSNVRVRKKILDLLLYSESHREVDRLHSGPRPLPHPSFTGDLFCSFFVILLTKQPNNQHMDTGENIENTVIDNILTISRSLYLDRNIKFYHKKTFILSVVGLFRCQQLNFLSPHECPVTPF